jgi:hypothetical protein
MAIPYFWGQAIRSRTKHDWRTSPGLIIGASPRPAINKDMLAAAGAKLTAHERARRSGLSQMDPENCGMPETLGTGLGHTAWS